MMSLNSTLEMINLHGSQDSEAIEAELMAEIQDALDPLAQKSETVPVVVADQKFKLHGQKSGDRDVPIVVADQKFKPDERNLDDRIVQMEFSELQSRIHTLCANDVPFGKSGMTAAAVTYQV